MCGAAFDVNNGWLLTGAVDGSLAMWSQEGRCLEVMRDLGGNVRFPESFILAVHNPMHLRIAAPNTRCLEVMRDLRGNVRFSESFILANRTPIHLRGPLPGGHA